MYTYVCIIPGKKSASRQLAADDDAKRQQTTEKCQIKIKKIKSFIRPCTHFTIHCYACTYNVQMSFLSLSYLVKAYSMLCQNFAFLSQLCIILPYFFWAYLMYVTPFASHRLCALGMVPFQLSSLPQQPLTVKFGDTEAIK